MKRWTPEDVEYLCENWGTVSVGGLCKKLNRTKNSIMVRVNRLGLPPFLEAGEYITMHQLLIALGYFGGDGYKTKSWIQNRAFPVHMKRRGEVSIKVVYIEEFWKWAESNRSFIDFSKMEPLALGIEPSWVPGQRNKDAHSFSLQRKDPWTPADDKRLIDLLRQHRYGYAELSELLRRSAGAIQRRCTDMGIKERPVKAENRTEWTDEDFQVVANGIRVGDSYTAIGRILGRSEKAVRGKVYYTYLTENADKIRAMMGNGVYGTGAPTPTVKQAIFLSRTKISVKSDLSKLAGLLAYRRNELGWSPFWQKDMCQHWDDMKGCTANEADCDHCTSFQRIQPQYCRRCGNTVISRKPLPNRLCERCRMAKKKQYQRKWHTLNGIEKDNQQA